MTATIPSLLQPLKGQDEPVLLPRRLTGRTTPTGVPFIHCWRRARRMPMTASVAALLQPLKDRLAAATPGPWRTGASGIVAGNEYIVTGVRTDEDANLIAAAPTDQAKLIAAIEAVAVLHKPVAGHNQLCECGIPAGAGASCEECQDAWPCPTVAALTQALGDG